MTVGIGVLCEDGNCAVVASDLRVTYGKTLPNPQHDRASKQYDFPPFNFVAATAGSTSSAHAIVSECSGQLIRVLQAWIKVKDKTPAPVIHFEHIRDAIEAGRKRELRRLQACAVERKCGYSLEDWIAGQLPSGRPFHGYTVAEGLRVLREVRVEMKSTVGIIVVGFLRENPIFFKAIGAEPIEDSATPHNYVIGAGTAAHNALDVLNARKQNIEMGIARTLLHVHEAMKAASSDKFVGEPNSYVVIRPHSVRRPNGIVRLDAKNPLLKQWSKTYKNKNSDGLDRTFANDLINEALVPNNAKRSQWLGPRSVMEEL